MFDEIPHDDEVERAVLGAALFDSEIAADIVQAVSPSDFYNPANKASFAAVTALTRRGLIADVLSVTQELRANGCLDDVGGMAYLTSVCGSVFTTANTEFFCQSLTDLANRRRLIRAAQRIAEAAMKGGDVADLMDKAEAAVCSVGNRRQSGRSRHVSEILPEVYTAIERRYDGEEFGVVASGLPDLDNMLGGGFRESELVIVAGRPGMGKSALCGDLTANVAGTQGKAVVIFTLEMSDRQFVQRIMAREARVNGKALQLGHVREDQWQDLNRAMGAMNRWPLHVSDQPDTSPMRMRAECRRLAQEGPLGMIIVDYIGLLDSDGGRDGDNRVQEVSKITRSLKRLAKEFSVPVIALSQLNRGVESRTNKRPMLSDLRESGSVEQDADKVLLLYRDEYYNPDSDAKGIAEIIIAKHRSGEVGTVKASFNKALTSFEPMGLTPEAKTGPAMWAPKGGAA
jgi:replicative DNA helicase